MPSDLPPTIVLDVSKFPAAVSRVEISSVIVNRFTAYKVNAVQFVPNLARVTFSSASDRETVMRLESVAPHSGNLRKSGAVGTQTRYKTSIDTTF